MRFIERDSMSETNKIKVALTYLVCLPISILLCLVWHEVFGHGLVGILAGGHITDLDLLGVRFLPEFGWSGIPGSIHIENIATPTGHELAVLSGPLSTWCVSVLAIVLLWVRRWKGLVRVILVCLSLWWYDILTETLSIWALPKGIWFHKGAFVFYSRPPVHYESAVRLGVPGSLFIIFSIGTSVCLLALLVIRLIMDHKRQRL